MTRRIGLIGLCCVTAGLLAVAGCSAEPVTPRDAGIQGGHDASVAKSYSTITEIRADSTAVVEGTVSAVRRTEPADQAGASGVKASVTAFNVTEVLSGSVAKEPTVLLHQILDPASGAPIDGTLHPGQAYVLFVTPFTYGPGTTATGEWVVVGGQGAYELQGSVLMRTSTVSSALPTTLSRSSLLAQVG